MTHRWKRGRAGRQRLHSTTHLLPVVDSVTMVALLRKVGYLVALPALVLVAVAIEAISYLS